MPERTDNLVDKARCPRCGYDLRGLIASWTESCPIEGRCAECGLAFEWGELLDPRRSVPRWCVEYARGWGMWPAAFKTLCVLLLRPDRFWRQLTMVHAPRWWRMPLVLLVALAALYLVMALGVGWATYRNHSNFNRNGAPTQYAPALIGLYAFVCPFSEYQFVAPPGTSRRGFADRTLPPRWYVSSLHFRWIIHDARLAVRGRRFLSFWNWHADTLPLFHSMMAAVLSPFAFILLPQSLRRAKVRLRHIIRIELYGLMLLSCPVAMYILFRLVVPYYPVLRSWQSMIVFLAFVFCFIAWWSLACRHYLKLPHAWGVGASMVVLAYAGGLFAVALVDYLLI